MHSKTIAVSYCIESTGCGQNVSEIVVVGEIVEFRSYDGSPHLNTPALQGKEDDVSFFQCQIT